MNTLADLGQHYAQLLARKTPQSQVQRKYARKFLAGGVTGNSKAWTDLCVSKANGSRVFDVDENAYIDLIMGFGPNLLGHNPEPVFEAARASLNSATPSGISTSLDAALAQRINEFVPSMELMRFVPSGTEATMLALRVARAYTGKPYVAKFEGHFHGQHDAALVSNLSSTLGGTADFPEGVADCAGLTPGTVDNTIVLSWHNLEATLESIKTHAKSLSAVILEPVPVSQMTGDPPEAEFLSALREITERHGILLIFDEVVTGFRLALGGAAEYFGVKPDLHVFGKVVGGGFPLGVYGGRKDIMEAVLTSPESRRRIYQSGTFSGLPISMAAGLATLNEIAATNALDIANNRAEEIRQGWRRLASGYGLEVQVTGIASLLAIFFSGNPIRTRRDILGTNLEASRVFSLGLLAGGVLLPPVHPGSASAAHTPQDVTDVLAISKNIMAQLKECI